jgi:hypothetical protein
MKDFKGFMSEGSKEEYQKFFDAKLKKYKVNSPEDLSDEEKKKFYDEIDKEWNADHESGKDGKTEALVKEYIKKDGIRRRCAGGDGRKNKKVKTEEEDCEDNEEMEEATGLSGQDWYEGYLMIKSGIPEAEVTFKVTLDSDKKSVKKDVLEAMLELAEEMEWYVKNNKRDIKIKKK